MAPILLVHRSLLALRLGLVLAVLVIDSPALVADMDALLNRDRNTSVYRLRLAADNHTIEWVATSADGKEIVFTDEPHNHWLLRLKMWLLEPFASEELL